MIPFLKRKSVQIAHTSLQLYDVASRQQDCWKVERKIHWTVRSSYIILSDGVVCLQYNQIIKNIRLVKYKVRNYVIRYIYIIYQWDGVGNKHILDKRLDMNDNSRSIINIYTILLNFHSYNHKVI